MRRTISGVLFLACLALSASAAYSSDWGADDNFTTIDGTVSSVDTLDSKITINAVNDLTFSVPINATIKQDIYDIKLSDINVGDYVTIEYYSDASGKKQAKTITVEYKAGEEYLKAEN